MGMLHQPSDVHVDITHGSSPPTVVVPLDRVRVLLSLVMDIHNKYTGFEFYKNSLI